LGHADIATTEIYAREDTELKHTALENAYPELIAPEMPPWNQDENLLIWLNSLWGSTDSENIMQSNQGRAFLVWAIMTIYFA